MEWDTIRWIIEFFLAVTLLPLVGWGIHVTWTLRKVRDDCNTLLNMHYHADDFGFGTGKTNRIIEDNTRAMKALTHYIRWLGQHQSGETPPPPLDGAGQD